MPLQQFDERIAQANTDQYTDTYTPGAWTSYVSSSPGDTRWDVMQALNNDTIDHKLALSYSTDFGSTIVQVTVPAGAGFAGVPPVDLLAAAMPAANHYLVQNQGANIWWSVAEAINTGKFVIIQFWGGTV